MVAETGLKCRMMANPLSAPGQHYVQSPPLLLILLLSLYVWAPRAQSTNASITGRVIDPSKAVIAEAKVAAGQPGHELWS